MPLDLTSPFLAHGGEMARRIRAHDWTTSPLGAPQSWPASLRSALSICLQSDYPTAIYWGVDLRLIYNDAWAPILDDRHPWALGRPAADVWPDIWHVIEPQIQQVLGERRAFATYDAMLPMLRNGVTRETYWTYSLTPITNERDAVAGIFNQGHETTGAVLAARNWRGEVERFRELFALAPGAVAVLRGPRHVFEMANPAYVGLVGGRDVVGKPLAEALPEVGAQGYITVLDGVLHAGVAHSEHGVRVQLLHDGRLQDRILDFVLQPMRDAHGRATGVLIQALDMTDRHLALQALRDADQRKDVFLATLSHELRNPLAPIRYGLALLERGLPSDSPLRPIRDMMGRQLTHLSHLVDDLMDVSRITSGKIRLRRCVTPLREVVDRAVEACSAATTRRSQQVIVHDAGAGLPVDGDPERLTQVFANLLNNASKFTREGGRIDLRLQGVGNEAVVDVADDGIGISPGDLARVFEMFVQVYGPDGDGADGHDKRSRHGGLGVGLALVAEIVRLHGGRVGATSSGPDQGSTFTVRLPIARPGST